MGCFGGKEMQIWSLGERFALEIFDLEGICI